MFARVRTCGTQVIIGKVRNKILSCVGNYYSIRLFRSPFQDISKGMISTTNAFRVKKFCQSGGKCKQFPHSV